MNSISLLFKTDLRVHRMTQIELLRKIIELEASLGKDGAELQLLKNIRCTSVPGIEYRIIVNTKGDLNFFVYSKGHVHEAPVLYRHLKRELGEVAMSPLTVVKEKNETLFYVVNHHAEKLINIIAARYSASFQERRASVEPPLETITEESGACADGSVEIKWHA